jgi:penicillin-binding protein 1B
MKLTEKKPNSIWRKLIDFFSNNQTRKYFRITYHLIWNSILLFAIALVLIFSFAGGVGAGYFASLVKDEPVRSKEDLSKDIYDYEEASDLYFANNVYLGKLQSDLEREEISLDQMSQHLLNAIVATEDEYYYEHDGVVPKAIMRAVFQEMTNAPIQSGGSTLTQQLVKNQVLTNEVSFDRKAKEILLALRVEKFFEKEEILQVYLNVSTFGRNSSGQNIAGVQSAAKGIFGVNAKDLTLPQAAFIAGLPQSPFRYTPFTQEGQMKTAEGLEPGLSRMKTVLTRMHDGGYITDQEYNSAVNYDIKADFIGPKVLPSKAYPWLTVELEKRAIDILTVTLAEADGYEKSDLDQDDDLKEQYTALADRELYQNGYKIYSTINKPIYDKMKDVVESYEYFGRTKTEIVTDPETGKKETVEEPVETGAILIENRTGKIISFVPGRDFEREQINHATSTERQNGSTIKPLLVYAPGMELGALSPGSAAVNLPISINGYTPGNAGEAYTGIETARTSLTRSYNVPTIVFYMSILNQRPANYLAKMGITSLTADDYENLSAALGTVSVSVEENVNAFSTFANNGQFIDGYMIDKIETKDGKVIYEHKAEPVEVFSPQTAYLTFDMMRDVISEGTARSLNGQLAFSADWAGKTGTTQNYHDAWFVATNPNVTFGTWIGYDTPKALDYRYKGLSYGQRNIKLWAELMNATYHISPELVAPKERVEMPGGIVRRSFCANSGLLPSDSCSNAGMVKSDLFNVKHVPTQTDGQGSDFFKRIGGQYLIDPSALTPKPETQPETEPTPESEQPATEAEQ